MANKLKTYETSLGFFDLAIAAPSMKAALEAWGADSNLFHQGAAKQSEDPDVVAARRRRFRREPPRPRRRRLRTRPRAAALRGRRRRPARAHAGRRDPASNHDLRIRGWPRRPAAPR